MKTKRKFLLGLALLAGLFGIGGFALAAVSPGWTADTDTPALLYDSQKMHIHRGVAAVNPGGLTWTSYNPVLTITPGTNFGIINGRVILNLDKTTVGFASAGTSQTITFDIARKVDGTNYVTSQNLETTALSATNSTARGIELVIGDIGPRETVQVMAKVSSVTSLQNFGMDYVLMYRSGTAAVISASN